MTFSEDSYRLLKEVRERREKEIEEFPDPKEFFMVYRIGRKPLEVPIVLGIVGVPLLGLPQDIPPVAMGRAIAEKQFGVRQEWLYLDPERAVNKNLWIEVLLNQEESSQGE